MFVRCSSGFRVTLQLQLSAASPIVRGCYRTVYEDPRCLPMSHCNSNTYRHRFCRHHPFAAGFSVEIQEEEEKVYRAVECRETGRECRKAPAQATRGQSCSAIY